MFWWTEWITVQWKERSEPLSSCANRLFESLSSLSEYSDSLTTWRLGDEVVYERESRTDHHMLQRALEASRTRDDLGNLMKGAGSNIELRGYDIPQEVGWFSVALSCGYSSDSVRANQLILRFPESGWSIMRGGKDAVSELLLNLGDSWSADFVSYSGQECHKIAVLKFPNRAVVGQKNVILNPDATNLPEGALLEMLSRCNVRTKLYDRGQLGFDLPDGNHEEQMRCLYGALHETGHPLF